MGSELQDLLSYGIFDLILFHLSKDFLLENDYFSNIYFEKSKMVTVAVAHDYSYEQWFVVGIYQNMQKAEDHYTQLLNDKPVSRMDGKAADTVG